jgi:alpha-galactosidase/6-phospho-beta-glucosidase family protein
MKQCKVVFVGAGSYVFGPAPIRDLFDRQKLHGIDLVLVDPNPQMLELMAGVARAAARKHGLDAVVSTTPDVNQALPGADFVICAVAVDQRRRFEIDLSIIARHAPEHRATEFGGVHGISMSVRQIAMIHSLCAAIRKHCPRAHLLNVANPLPRVCQAAHEAGVTAIGFCSASLGVYADIWRILQGGDALHFPFEPAVSRLALTIAGLNHHTFVLDARDETGTDLRPAMIERLRAGRTSGNPRAEGFLLDHGAMLAVNDGHTRDFFAPEPGRRPLDHISHGDAAERAARLQLLQDIGAGKAEVSRAFEPQAWEYPGDYIAAVAYGRDIRFHSLNLINNGQIPQLPRHVFVEAAATGRGGVVAPDRVDLPSALVPYCLRTAAVTDAIVQAATRRSRAMLKAAVELDPTVIDKQSGWRAVEACLQAHADLIGAYD